MYPQILFPLREFSYVGCHGHFSLSSYVKNNQGAKFIPCYQVVCVVVSPILILAAVGLIPLWLTSDK